jgi:RecB family endonuclease NucS
VEIAKERFLLESEVQQLTEANLQDLFDLTLVKSEFELHGLRIDTLAFDKESGAFVIIEYKKDRNFSIVDLLTGNVRRPWMRPRKFSFGC